MDTTNTLSPEQGAKKESAAHIPPLPPLGESIRSSFQFVFRRPDLFLWYGAFFVLTTGIAYLPEQTTLFETVQGEGHTMQAVLLGLLLLSIVLCVAASVIFSTALFYVAVHSEKHLRFWEAVGWVFRNLTPLLIIWLFMLLVNITAYTLFILPGIVLGVFLLFVLPVYMREGYRGIDALVRSTDLVRGAAWVVIWRLVVLVVIVLLLLIAGGMLIPFLLSVTGSVGSLSGVIIGEAAFEAVVYVLVTAISILVTLFSYAYIAQLANARIAATPPVRMSGYRTVRMLYRVFAIVGAALIVGSFVAAGWMLENPEWWTSTLP